jgi:hypothetical protein
LSFNTFFCFLFLNFFYVYFLWVIFSFGKSTRGSRVFVCSSEDFAF